MNPDWASRRPSAELTATEDRWKFACDASGDGVWDWGVLAGTVFFSARWKARLGFAEGDEERRRLKLIS